MAITTAEFTIEMAALFEGHGVAIEDEAGFSASLAALYTAWTNEGSEGFPTPALAVRVATLLANWNTNQLQFRAWWVGPANGGWDVTGTTPGGGYYPLTDGLGNIRFLPSPDKMLSDLARGYSALEVLIEAGILPPDSDAEDFAEWLRAPAVDAVDELMAGWSAALAEAEAASDTADLALIEANEAIDAAVAAVAAASLSEDNAAASEAAAALSAASAAADLAAIGTSLVDAEAARDAAQTAQGLAEAAQAAAEGAQAAVEADATAAALSAAAAADDAAAADSSRIAAATEATNAAASAVDAQSSEDAAALSQGAAAASAVAASTSEGNAATSEANASASAGAAAGSAADALTSETNAATSAGAALAARNDTEEMRDEVQVWRDEIEGIIGFDPEDYATKVFAKRAAKKAALIYG